MTAVLVLRPLHGGSEMEHETATWARKSLKKSIWATGSPSVAWPWPTAFRAVPGVGIFNFNWLSQFTSPSPAAGSECGVRQNCIFVGFCEGLSAAPTAPPMHSRPILEGFDKV